MKSRNLATAAQKAPTNTVRSDVRAERGKKCPSVAEIRQRAFEIHMELGGLHGCDLDDWLQGERELREKLNNNDVDPRKE